MADAQKIAVAAVVIIACLVTVTFVAMMWRIARRSRADYVPDALERRMINYLHRELCIKPAMLDTDTPAVTLAMMFHATSGEVMETRRKTFFPSAPDSAPSPDASPRLAS